MITFTMISTSLQMHTEHGSDEDIFKISVQDAYLDLFRWLSVGVMIMFYVEVDFYFVCIADIITHMCVCTSSPTGSITISL